MRLDELLRKEDLNVMELTKYIDEEMRDEFSSHNPMNPEESEELVRVIFAFLSFKNADIGNYFLNSQTQNSTARFVKIFEFANFFTEKCPNNKSEQYYNLITFLCEEAFVEIRDTDDAEHLLCYLFTDLKILDGFFKDRAHELLPFLDTKLIANNIIPRSYESHCVISKLLIKILNETKPKGDLFLATIKTITSCFSKISVNIASHDNDEFIAAVISSIGKLSSTQQLTEELYYELMDSHLELLIMALFFANKPQKFSDEFVDLFINIIKDIGFALNSAPALLNIASRMIFDPEITKNYPQFIISLLAVINSEKANSDCTFYYTQHFLNIDSFKGCLLQNPLLAKKILEKAALADRGFIMWHSNIFSIINLCNAFNQFDVSQFFLNHQQNDLIHQRQDMLLEPWQVDVWQIFSIFLQADSYEKIAQFLKISEIAKEYCGKNPNETGDKLIRVLYGFLTESLVYRSVDIPAGEFPPEKTFGDGKVYFERFYQELDPIFLSLNSNPRIFGLLEEISKDYTVGCVNQRLFAVAIIGVISRLAGNPNPCDEGAITKAMQLLLLIELCRMESELYPVGVSAEVANAILSTACKQLFQAGKIEKGDIIYPHITPFAGNIDFEALAAKIKDPVADIFTLFGEQLYDQFSKIDSFRFLSQALFPDLVYEINYAFQTRRKIAFNIQQIMEENGVADRDLLEERLEEDEIPLEDLDKLLPNFQSLTMQEINLIIMDQNNPQEKLHEAIKSLVKPAVSLAPLPDAQNIVHESVQHNLQYNYS